MEELVGVIVGKDDPEIRIKRTQSPADIGGNFAHMRDHCLVFGFRQGEELRRMWQHGAANHG
jgi:hypothetical protein